MAAKHGSHRSALVLLLAFGVSCGGSGSSNGPAPATATVPLPPQPSTEQSCEGETGPVFLECYYPAKPAAPAGSFPETVELDLQESHTLTLTDNQTRTVKLLNTSLVHSSPGGYQGGNVTVWATATIEVSGDGLPPVSAEIPAAHFHRPRIIHDVRVMVDVTREFNDNNLRDGGGTDKAARLVLSDGRSTMTDVSRYRYPFPSQLWQEGSNVTHWQALQGNLDGGLYHHGGFDQGMPRGTPVYSWHGGTVVREDRGFDRTVRLRNADDGRSEYEHSALHFDAVDPALDGQRVEQGAYLGTSGVATWPHIHWANDYSWGPTLAEWYVAQNDPIKLSYVKSWLAAGPYDAGMGVDSLAGESTAAPNAPTWKVWDNMVPGVVMVREALTDYPYSGWADVNGSYAGKVAYLFVYAHSNTAQNAVLRVGHSDPIKAWWNGYPVIDNAESVDTPGTTSPSIVVDRFQVPISLQAGPNRLLIKTMNAGPESWQVCARISDDAGNVLPGIRYSVSP
ncbi:MAG: M23 family metallopeptidase [Planctomycetes bacterium]|nr:M23 family metallopeptidase [Planctomycetota bacterium]